MSENTLAEREKIRYTVLKAMFDITEGAGINPSNKTFTLDELAQKTGLYSKLVDNALNYLLGEGLIDHGDFKLEFGEDTPHRITHRGIEEIDASLKQPEQNTQHFSPITIQNNIYGNLEAQTVGNQNTISFTRNSYDSARIVELITQLRSEISTLEAGDQKEAREYIEDIEVGVAKEQPRLSRIRAAGMAMLNLLQIANQSTHNLSELLGRFGIDLPKL